MKELLKEGIVMKKRNVVALIFTFLLSIFGMFFNSNTYALGEDVNCFGKTDMVSDYVKSYTLGDGIIKKEVVSTYKYVYTHVLKNSNEKYITLQVNVSYTEESSGKVLAVASLESNFRYNSVTKEAICLSATKGNVLNVDGCELSVFSTPANLNTKLGGSIMSLKFKYNGKVYDDVVHEVRCDYLGNLSYN